MNKIAKIAVIVSILFFTAGCGTNTNTIDTSSTGNDFTNQDSKAVMTLTQTNLAKAKVAATVWKSDAYYAALNFRVPGDLNPQSLSQTFVFGSGQDTDNWFTYSIDTQSKFVRAVIPKSDFLGTNLQPIQENYVKKSYIEILRTAEDNGGTAYRAQHPEAQTTITLSQTEPKNWGWYTVEYRSATDAQKVRISANDGKIYNDTGVLVTK